MGKLKIGKYSIVLEFDTREEMNDAYVFLMAHGLRYKEIYADGKKL